MVTWLETIYQLVRALLLVRYLFFFIGCCRWLHTLHHFLLSLVRWPVSAWFQHQERRLGPHYESKDSGFCCYNKKHESNGSSIALVYFMTFVPPVITVTGHQSRNLCSTLTSTITDRFFSNGNGNSCLVLWSWSCYRDANQVVGSDRIGSDLWLFPRGLGLTVNITFIIGRTSSKDSKRNETKRNENNRRDVNLASLSVSLSVRHHFTKFSLTSCGICWEIPVWVVRGDCFIEFADVTFISIPFYIPLPGQQRRHFCWSRLRRL